MTTADKHLFSGNPVSFLTGLLNSYEAHLCCRGFFDWKKFKTTFQHWAEFNDVMALNDLSPWRHDRPPCPPDRVTRGCPRTGQRQRNRASFLSWAGTGCCSGWRSWSFYGATGRRWRSPCTGWTTSAVRNKQVSLAVFDNSNVCITYRNKWESSLNVGKWIKKHYFHKSKTLGEPSWWQIFCVLSVDFSWKIRGEKKILWLSELQNHLYFCHDIKTNCEIIA